MVVVSANFRASNCLRVVRASPVEQGADPHGSVAQVADEDVDKLIGQLTLALVELDRMGAAVAAAHLDQAREALIQQFRTSPLSSDPE